MLQGVSHTFWQPFGRDKLHTNDSLNKKQVIFPANLTDFELSIVSESHGQDHTIWKGTTTKKEQEIKLKKGSK